MGRYSGKTCRVLSMLALTASFFLVEIVVGYVTNSITLVANSFHMLSDVVALIVGFASIRISKLPSRNNTYGWVRAEIVGALVNAAFLLALCFSILVESLKRLVSVEEMEQPVLLLIVGGVNFLVNLIGLILFHNQMHVHSHGDGAHTHGGDAHSHSNKGGHSHNHNSSNKGDHSHEENSSNMDEAKALVLSHSDEAKALVRSHSDEAKALVLSHSDTVDGKPLPEDLQIEIEHDSKPRASAQQMNMRGVFLHVLGDALGSVVVIISSLVIWLADGHWRFYVDPAMSIAMVIIILSTTIPLLKQTSLILLQTTPNFLDQHKLKEKLVRVPGVLGVHEFHVWQLTGNRVVLSAHITCSKRQYRDLAAVVDDLFRREGIHSTTVQPEFVEVGSVGGGGGESVGGQPTDASATECKLICVDKDRDCQPDTECKLLCVDCQPDTCCDIAETHSKDE